MNSIFLLVALFQLLFIGKVCSQDNELPDMETHLRAIQAIIEYNLWNVRHPKVTHVYYDISNKLYFRNNVGKVVDSLVNIDPNLDISYNDTIVLDTTETLQLNVESPAAFRIKKIPEKRHGGNRAIYFSPLAKKRDSEDEYLISYRNRSYDEEIIVVYSMKIINGFVKNLKEIYHEYYIF